MAKISNQQKEKQIQEVLQTYDGLCLDLDAGVGYIAIYGDLNFRAQYGDRGVIEDCFAVEIRVPNDYPTTMPTTRETCSRMSNDFEHINSDGHFCLAADMAELMAFNKNPTLKGYIENLVIPYLYGYVVWEKTGEMPFDELGHGAIGILEWYSEQIEPQDNHGMILGLWKISREGYKCDVPCVCGSGQLARKCHHKLLRKFSQPSYKDQLLVDVYLMAEVAGLTKSTKVTEPALKPWLNK